MNNIVTSESSDDESHTVHLRDDILFPREVLSRTNWLYRVDALRVHDKREMKQLWELTLLLLQYLAGLVSYAAVLIKVMRRGYGVGMMTRLRNTYRDVIKMIELTYSEGYCYFLE